MNESKFQSCIGCKAIYTLKEHDPMVQAAVGAGINRYGVTSLECIATFVEILAREQEWFGYPPAHRLIVDAYSVQHPPHLEHQLKLGISTRLIKAGVQSVSGHLIILYCIFEKRMDFNSATKVLGRVIANMNALNANFPNLKAPDNLGKIKAIDFLKELENQITLEKYTQLAWDWAKEAYDAWKDQHSVIKDLYAKYSGA